MMEENYKKWHNHTEQQLAAHIAAAEDKAAADAEARRRRWVLPAVRPWEGDLPEAMTAIRSMPAVMGCS